MLNLALTETDTKPTVCNLAMNLTGCTITLNIGYPTPLAKQAVITDVVTGTFEYRWGAGDLVPGIWAASMTIVDGNGYRETTDPFTISIDRSL